MIILEFFVWWLILSGAVWVGVVVFMLWFEMMIYTIDGDFLFFKSDKLETLSRLLILAVWSSFPLAIIIVVTEKLL